MTHADEARRIAVKFTVLANEAEITLEGCIAAALAAADAAAERRGIERLRPALEQFDIDYYCEQGQPESEACKYAPSVLADAIRALLPAEPAAKCATCGR